jgi:hypothetical protein
MLTRQVQVTETSSAMSAFKDISLTTKVKTKTPNSHPSLATKFISKNAPKHLFKKTLISCSEIFLLTFAIFSNASATDGPIRWYRFYDSRGIPTISSTVSEQHLQQGYDVLDSHMQLIRHYQPFSADKYAQQQIIREQAISKRISDRHLQETYVSSDHAIIQRDRELSNLDSQIKRSEQESKSLSSSLNASITLAANFDRQNKPIPAQIKAQLEKNKSLLAQSNASLSALKSKREESNNQFNNVIAQLKTIETQSNKPDTTNTP